MLVGRLLTTLVEDPQRCSSKFPTLWSDQRSVPGWVPARILSVRAWWSRSLYESPAMSRRTTDLCRSLSRRAAIISTMLSPRTSPQEVTGLLVVRMIEVLRYRWATTWNNAEAASAGSGK